MKFVRLFFWTLLLFLFIQNKNICQSGNSKQEKEHSAVKSYMEKALHETKNSVREKIDPKDIDADKDKRLYKTTGIEDRKSYFMNGNKISVELFNYGGIAPGYGLIREVTGLVWRNLPYIFQFGPLVGASVPDADNPQKKHHIISDALNDYPGLREVSPAGDTLWQWQPVPGFADPDQPLMASSPAEDIDADGKPDSWPREWYNPALGKYVWPGFLSQDASNADLEVFWVMDDRDNSEYNYFPFDNDPTRRGLGVQVQGRAFQWSNALAENAIFFVYTITNVSDKDLDSVIFGIYGDPDIGGVDNDDDNGFFIPPYADDGSVDNIPVYARSLVYFWDPDGIGDRGLPLGYLGCKFLESPGNPDDGIDNDGDGLIDERQDDGIDNDGDWNPAVDDLGVDGIARTDDEGEGDGLPTGGIRLADGRPDPLFPGEPNYEFTDLDEADQIGLTSFNSWTWNEDKISDDESMWFRSTPRNFGDIQQSTDIVFIYGSGYISLKKGETKRISMALLFGEDLNDLLTSSETVQRIYNENYRFFRPPNTPSLRALPGDQKVTLYWDTIAEESIDPITGKDFQGYVIYRSTSPDFNDIQNITDGRGSSFLNQPLKDINGFDARWDLAVIDEPYTDRNGNGIYDNGEIFKDYSGDGKWSAGIEDPWKGYHPVPYQGRGVQYYLGDNSGLVHSFVDSNNVINGQTYYYALVAYDHGDSIGIPPTETTKKISEDPITSKLKFDLNTVQVIPGPRSSGYIPPVINGQNLIHEKGSGTGSIIFEIISDLEVLEGGEYTIIFSDSLEISGLPAAVKNYSVRDNIPKSQSLFLYDTNFTQLNFRNIINDEFLALSDLSGNIYKLNNDYILNFERGSIRRTGSSSIPVDSEVLFTFRYFPVSGSRSFGEDDSNPVFDGIKLRVMDENKLAFDETRTDWIEGNSNFEIKAGLASWPITRILEPSDYEVEFSADYIDSALFVQGGMPMILPVKYSVGQIKNGIPQRVLTWVVEDIDSLANLSWDPGEEIMIFKPGSTGQPV